LQGWAIVDNTVGQDWENVQLSLVAGAPQSFVQNLSQPYFARRPVVALPESMAASPQTYEATLIGGGARLAGRITDATGADIVSSDCKRGSSIRQYGIEFGVVLQDYGQRKSPGQRHRRRQLPPPIQPSRR